VASAALVSFALAGVGLGATLTLLRARRRGDAIGQATHWQQLLLVAPGCLLAAFLAWRLRPIPGTNQLSKSAFVVVGIAIIALSFGALVAERFIASISIRRLPEATSLRALALLPVILPPMALSGAIAGELGAPIAAGVIVDLTLLVAFAVGVELTIRAFVRLFLPPPVHETAKAAVESTLTKPIAEGLARRRLTDQPRPQFGIDFSRSCALAYARAAAVPLLPFLLLLSWGLSGIVLVSYSQCAIYERFGAPVAVFGPGLHLVLPWPLGKVRLVEFGAVHETLLVDAALSQIDEISAEASPPPSLDRLWEQAHPAEAEYLVANDAGVRKSFHSVAADLRVQWRVGLTQDAALEAAYRTEAPKALVRSTASRTVARALATRTLDEVLGENRDRFADMLRAALQADLDRLHSGIDIVALIVEALHPPSGAAQAYHGVQAAEITASALVAAERGRAAAVRTLGQQRSTEQIAQAQALAAELLAQAKGDAARFDADREGAAKGKAVFIRERYYEKLVAALSHVPITLVDNRLGTTDAPVLDLRPPVAGAAPAKTPPE
jgi:regulator of protease activity HflC (stomatin/prohibitin superfamily)